MKKDEMVVGLCEVVAEMNREKEAADTRVERLLGYIRFVEAKLAGVAELVGCKEGELLADIKQAAGYDRPKHLIDKN